jgi:hypothetical protein
MKSKLDQLIDAKKVQCADGNWNYSPYMHGMANGIIFAIAILEDKEPKYLTAPKEWGEDQDTSEVLSEQVCGEKEQTK